MKVEDMLRTIVDILVVLPEVDRTWITPSPALDAFTDELIALGEKWRPILELELEVMD